MNTSYRAYRALRKGIGFDNEYVMIFLLFMPFIVLGVVLGVYALTGQLGGSAEATEATEEIASLLNQLIV